MNQATMTVLAIVGALAIIWLAVFSGFVVYDAVADDNLMDGMWDMMGDMGDMGDMHGMMGGGGPETTASTSGKGEVSITDFSFQPTVLTVTPGTVVTWTNDDSAPHTATGDGFDTGRLDDGESGQLTFETSGTYEYRCEFHSYMVGKIVVSSD